jgi:non-ribosomal peptide synthetase component F
MLFDLFEKAFELYSDLPALLLEDCRIVSYSQLNQMASKLEYAISQLIQHDICNQNGVGTPLVCLMIQRDVGYIAALLATLKAKAACVPVDPAFPPERQSYILTHSKCELLIIDEDSYVSVLNMKLKLPPFIVINKNTAEIVENINNVSHNFVKTGNPINDPENWPIYFTLPDPLVSLKEL